VVQNVQIKLLKEGSELLPISNEDKSGRYAIYTTTGALIAKGSIAGQHQQRLDMGQAPSGTYVVRYFSRKQDLKRQVVLKPSVSPG